MNRLLASAALVGLVAGGASMTTSGAQPDCSSPSINALTEAEAAISRPAVASPAIIALSGVYSWVEQATLTDFTYAEAGPQNAGVFEALAPPGTPTPPRAVSAHPSEDIPDEDTEEWGGRSHTQVSAISASAASSGASDAGMGGATARSSHSFATTRVDCDVVTIIAGWEANDVTLAPGVTAEQLGETVTLVVGPDGSSSDVETTVVGVEGATVAGQGRPADPFTDPMYANGGPRLDIGESRTEAADDGASAAGGGFNFFQADPETGQGAGYSFGAVNATIDVLGDLVVPVPAVAPTPPAAETPSVRGRDVTRPVSTGTTQAAVGTPPAPSAAAVEEIESVLVTDDLVSFVTVEHRSWFPLLAALGTVALLGSMVGSVAIGRRWFPTLDFIARHSARNGERFAAIYLRW